MRDRFSTVGKKIYDDAVRRIVKCESDQAALDAVMLLAYDAGRAKERANSTMETAAESHVG